MYESESAGDIFGFVIDDVHRYKLDQTVSYLIENVPLPAGHHTFKWVYYKNPEIGLGADIARISFIEVVGIQAADDISCTSCIPGMFQPAAEQYYCLYCPENTYAPDFRTTECTPCPSGFYSYTGAETCTPYERPCSPEDDSIFLYTDCEYSEFSSSWTRTKYYQWNVPLFCDNSLASLPANQTNLPCSECSPGYYIKSDGTCEMCESGKSSSGNERSCTTCQAGTAAVGELYFTSWDQWQDNYFETFCYGRCATTGWQLNSDFVRATLPTNSSVDLLLQLDVEIYFHGSISVSFIIHPAPFNSSYFEITVDGNADGIFQQTDTMINTTIALSNGPHTIGFWAHGSGIETSYVDIYSIVVTGSREGGASTCSPCPPGYYQNATKQNHCIKCELGYYANTTGSTSCTICPANTFASKPGTDVCTACPVGGHSGPGSVYCQNPNCTFTYTNENSTEFTYNLSPYSGLPQFVENSGEEFRGYYLVSYCGTIAEQDSPCVDSHLCEIYVNFNPYNPSQNFLNWATLVSFESLPNPKDGFVLQYTGGEDIGCTNDTRTATVYLYCTIETHEMTTLNINETQSTACHKVFSQRTIYGCPTCHLSDFDKVEEDCKDGKRTVHYNKKPTAKCNGIVKTVQEECGQYETDFILFAILAVFIIMVAVALVAAVIYLLIKTKRLQFKYSKLQEEKASEVELDDIGQPTTE